MSLETQIREYVRGATADQKPLTADEIVQHSHLARPISGIRAVNRSWIAIAAAAVTLALFGALSWVLNADRHDTADSLPAQTQGGIVYYAPEFVPDLYAPALSYAAPIGGGFITYLKDLRAEEWVPSMGGFTIQQPFGWLVSTSETPEDLLSRILSTTTGASRVEIAGRPGLILETVFDQAGIPVDYVSVIADDGAGSVFEVTAVGMTRDQVLAIAERVRQVTINRIREIGKSITWDLGIAIPHTDFAYEIPAIVTDLAEHVSAAMGTDLLTSRLLTSYLSDETVVTMDDGSVVDGDGSKVLSSLGYLFIDVPNGIDDALAALADDPSLRGLELSPQLAAQRDEILARQVLQGSVLSEDPYIVQAPLGPTPSFDPKQIGPELPMDVATSPDVVPLDQFDPGMLGYNPMATSGRPIIVIGTAADDEVDANPFTLIYWFIESGGVCEGIADEEGFGSSCGLIPMTRFGPIAQSSETGGASTLSYAVPLEASVVRIITDSGDYWQRPVSGFGLVVYGISVPRPTEIVALDKQGREIGRWEVERTG